MREDTNESALRFAKNSRLIYGLALTKHSEYISRCQILLVATMRTAVVENDGAHHRRVERISSDFVIVRKRERIHAIIKINGSRGQLVYFLPLATILCASLHNSTFYRIATVDGLRCSPATKGYPTH